ncbi:MAG: DEAD/DEAH box helicase [Clostridiaceae bacterium]|nr:DEAD/DEAH box helicase [Clostridiaceae bacterium]
MNYIRLNEKEISNYIGDSRIFHRGRMYFFNKFVEDVSVDELKDCITARVRGGTCDYQVKIFFDSNKDIYSQTCTCPYYQEFWKPCKHIAAVLFELNRMAENEQIKHKNSYKAVNAVFKRMESEGRKSSASALEQIHLYPTLHIARQHNDIRAWLELKAGISRPYVVKSAEEFLDAWVNGKKLRFGNELTLDSSKQYFSGRDHQVMEMIKDIYLTDVELGYLNRHNHISLVKGRQITLTPSKLEKFLDIMTGDSVNASIFYDGINTVPVVQESVPAVFEIRQLDEWLSVRMGQNSIPVELIPGTPFYYLDGKIYKVPDIQKKYLSIIREGFSVAETNEILVPAEYQSRFISEVVPIMKKTGDVMVTPALKEKIVQEPLKAEVYLDQYRSGICARVIFHYGKYRINPASGGSSLIPKNTYILRDIEAEQPIISFLQEAGFSAEDDQYVLTDKEKIYLFAFEQLPRLQEIADVYYSEDFKKITVKREIRVSGRVSLVGDLLEVTFDTGELDPEELKGILQSLRRKKKFYRLKDGGILPLTRYPDLNELLHFADQMDLSPKDLDGGKFYIPRYRAFYLDSFFSETDSGIIEKTQDFDKYIKSIYETRNRVYEIPKPLENVLRDYQKSGFQWLKALSESGLGGILADDMGLGKTLQVLTLILSEKENRKAPALVIAPTSLVYNWRLEAEKFAPELKVAAITGTQAKRQQLLERMDEYDLIITSYPLIRRDIEAYRKYSFSFCIIDEAQNVKNHYTQSAKAIRKISAQNCFALTGTPMENSLMELWSIFDFIMPGYLYTQQKFEERFVKPIINDGNKNAGEDLRRHIRPFILRRMKKDVLKELPDKIETVVTCELTKAQRDIYLAVLAQARNEIEESIKESGLEKSQLQILAALTRLRQICCHPASFIEDYNGGSGKTELLGELLEENLALGHRILLFSQFTSMLDIIEEDLKKKGISYFYLSGKTPAEERASMVSRFNGGEGDVFLLSLKAGGTGLTLTGADTVIHFDPWWNPAVEDQATDRAYRIGQEKMVHVFKLITQDTIEEKILLLQKKKKELIDLVIKPGETLLSKLTQEEIRQLFEA